MGMPPTQATSKLFGIYDTKSGAAENLEKLEEETRQEFDGNIQWQVNGKFKPLYEINEYEPTRYHPDQWVRDFGGKLAHKENLKQLVKRK